jgi:predicted ATPase
MDYVIELLKKKIEELKNKKTGDKDVDAGIDTLISQIAETIKRELAFKNGSKYAKNTLTKDCTVSNEGLEGQTTAYAVSNEGLEEQRIALELGNRPD